LRKIYKENTARFPRIESDHFFSFDQIYANYNGVIQNTFDFVEKNQLLDVDLWKRFAQQFKEDADYEGGWRGEYWGKMMRGACFVYAYTKNPELYNILANTVRDMMGAQDPSGRISSYAVSHEFEAWDIWCRKYVLLGMQYFLEISQDEVLSREIVQSMRQQMDYIIERIGSAEEGKTPITKATRHWRGLNSSSLLEPVVRLYSITKEEKYFDFATYIVSTGCTDVVNIFDLAYENKLLPYQYPITKAYEMTSCFEGLLEYYRVTGESRYRTAVINFADRILENDFTIIGCSGCTHELFDHSTVRQANTNVTTTMQETCVTVTLMKFFTQLALLTGEAKYVDAFERSFYNAYLGSLNTEGMITPSVLEKYPDWTHEPLPFDSYSPLTAGIRGKGVGGLKPMSDNHYYGCCACIGAAGIGLVPQIATVASAEGIVLNLYADGEFAAQTPAGKPLIIKTKTKYPADGEIKITLEPEVEENFTVFLRIPQWSYKTQLFVNGSEIIAKPEYVEIVRKWSSGDEITLRLDMRTEAIYPTPYGSQILMNKVIWGANYMIPTFDEEDPMAKNHIALRYGPIIFAQDSRLGYRLEDPVEIKVEEDGFVDVRKPPISQAPYTNIIEMNIPLSNGKYMLVTDYASAGKLWSEDSMVAAWMLTTKSKGEE